MNFWSISPDLSQAVPLVPLTETNEDAMDNKSFQKLLHKLGIRPPANEQVCLRVCILHFIIGLANRFYHSLVERRTICGAVFVLSGHNF